jgi:hypothetical protein
MTYQLHEPPIPEQPDQPAAIPMIYVTEPARWAYKQLQRDLDAEGLLDEEALNGLGEEGWELAAALAHGSQVTYIFKRVAD